jgi:hypothetical protein
MNKREWMLQAAIGISPVDGPGSTAEYLSALYDAIITASPETAQEGAWVEHDGDVSKAPEERRMVEVMFREGGTEKDPSESFVWDHGGDGFDIVRWRYA